MLTTAILNGNSGVSGGAMLQRNGTSHRHQLHLQQQLHRQRRWRWHLQHGYADVTGCTLSANSASTTAAVSSINAAATSPITSSTFNLNEAVTRRRHFPTRGGPR